jgi:hypothetical protein
VTAQACLEQAATIRLNGAGTASDKKALISAAGDAMKAGEVLTGGVLDRQERAAGMAQEAREALRQHKKKRRSAAFLP